MSDLGLLLESRVDMGRDTDFAMNYSLFILPVHLYLQVFERPVGAVLITGILIVVFLSLEYCKKNDM